MQQVAISAEKMRDLMAELWGKQYELCRWGTAELADAGKQLDWAITRLQAAGVDIECDHVQAVRLDAVKTARNQKGRY
jgi:hypothetical protein